MSSNKSSISTTVLEVQSKKYELKRVICRENGLMLYGPMPGVEASSSEYDIVLPQPVSKNTYSAFSLCRTSDQYHAKNVFQGLKQTIPYFVNVSKKYSKSQLQEICDNMLPHPSWSLAHLVVQMNKVTLLEDPLVQCHINDIDSEEGMTPIMIAITNKNFEMVKALVTLQCSLNILSAGNSVIHFAAANDKKILNYLLALNDGKRWINSTNNYGFTPIHCACESDKIECVQILLDSGAKFEGDDSYASGSPLHLCKSKIVLEKLLNNGHNVNAVNKDNETPLHIMVKNSFYDCSIVLLANSADPSASDKNGDTPLHIAIRIGDIKITKALIVFDADLNYLNKNGHTPRHYIDICKVSSAKLIHILHAVGAKRCQPDTHGCQDFCSYNGSNDGAMTPSQEIYPAVNPLEHILTVAGMEKASIESRKIAGGRLLCLDGGGIRGLILIQILIEFQKLANKPIIQCFDWVAGTSVGGILSLALAMGKSLSECRCLFFKLKDNAFVGERPYSSEIIENLFKENFGDDTYLSSIKHPKLLITSVKADRYPLGLQIFRNFPSPLDIINFGIESPSNIPRKHIWEVARCTSAAPTYFNSCKNYLDGGLIANNPTLDALTEIFEYNLALRTIGKTDTIPFASIVLSCGTGLIPYTNITDSLFDTNWSSTGFVGKAFILASRIKHIGNLIVELIAGSDGRLVDRARAWCAATGVPYYRFNPPISSNVSIDETSNEIIIDILWETKAYMHNNYVLTKEVVDCLFQE